MVSPFYDGPRLRKGWLEIPCDAPDQAKVYMSVGESEYGEWFPGFRDWDENGRRVAKIRPPRNGSVYVWTKIDGHVTRHQARIIL